MRSTVFLTLVPVLLATFAGVAAAQGNPVALRDLARGEVLKAEDIAFAGDTAGEAGSDMEVGPGWVTRRVITAGEALRRPAVVPPQMVHAGQFVEVLWQNGHVELRLRGKAANSAALGERVHVRIDAQRRFEGEAVGPGEVRLNSRR